MTISGTITSNQNIGTITLVIGNITNPLTAGLYSTFSGIIGNDTSALNNNASVTIVAANFPYCSINFDPPLVNENSTMMVSLTPKHPIDNDYVILITLPSNWSNENPITN
jgi:hypothetical protein